MPKRDNTGKPMSGAAKRKQAREHYEATAADIREAAAFGRLVRRLRGEDDLTAAAAMLRFVAERWGSDPAPTPAARARRSGVTSSCQGLAKVADPKKLIDELGADVRAQQGVIERLRGRRGPQEHPRDPQGTTPDPH